MPHSLYMGYQGEAHKGLLAEQEDAYVFTGPLPALVIPTTMPPGRSGSACISSRCSPKPMARRTDTRRQEQAEPGS